MTAEQMVATATGPVPVTALGRTLMHEHLFVVNPEVELTWPDAPGQFNEEEQMAEAVTLLTAMKAQGFDTMVELTVFGLGRNIPRVVRVAEQAGVNVIVATGIYVLNEMPLYFQYRGPGSQLGGPDRLAEFFIRDITEGIQGTNVHAAILKCVTDEAGLTTDVERAMRSVARAHRETGVPITTHTHAGLRRGLDQQRIFKEEGVDLSRVIVGHSGDTDDYGYLEELIAQGSYLGMDRFGLPAVSVDKRIEIVVEMCRRGYADRMVLSHDWSCFMDIIDVEERRKMTPHWGWTLIADKVLPALLERGVTQRQIDVMLIENPRRIFTTQGGY